MDRGTGVRPSASPAYAAPVDRLPTVESQPLRAYSAFIMDQNTAVSNAVTAPQHEQYRRDGYLLIPGLLGPDVVERARRAMWRVMGLSPDRPQEWPDGKAIHKASDDHDLLACYSDKFMAAVLEFGGEDPAPYDRPREAREGHQ